MESKVELLMLDAEGNRDKHENPSERCLLIGLMTVFRIEKRFKVVMI